ncbi:endonuclease/exonuclease/phosphatase family protein [Pseudonocardia alni]|uniref:endonuclease/exonuclease/phosphatase family protein n=1 Tax=Pseudonocardia alni TaxID=33907 RepID=UPI0033DF5A6C
MTDDQATRPLRPATGVHRWRGRALVVVSAATALLIAGHQLLPDVAGVGTLLDSAAPWLGLAVPPLLIVALRRRTRSALAALVPLVVWCVVFGPALLPQGGGTGGDLRVVGQNLWAGNTDPDLTASDLAATGADVVGVQELTGRGRRAVERALGDELPYHAGVGTVGIWSRYPIGIVERVDLGLGWARALRAAVDTPHGPVVVYVAHLPSLRPGTVDSRDRALTELAARLRADDATRGIVLADLNTGADDRAMRLLPTTVRPVLLDAGSGFGFTWPAVFPVVRLDHVLQWGLRPADSSTVHTRGTDHRAVQADLAFG